MVAITGGGTGGHLQIVKLLKKELNRRGIEPVFIGSTAGKDREWIGKDLGWKKKYFLKSRGVANRHGIQKIRAIGEILGSVGEAGTILRREKVEKVVSVGGYSSAPATFGAIVTFRSLFIHEQNSRMGLVTKIARPFARHLFNSFFGRDPYPVGEDFFKTARIRRKIGRVIFLGGSQGAVPINRLAIQLVPEFLNRGIEVIHQTGERGFREVETEYQKLGIANKVNFFSFSNNLAQLMGEADLAISRAGASTLFELVSNGLPSIFIPYPYATDNHQYFNALFLVKQELGELVEEKEDLSQLIWKKIEQIEKRIEEISKKLLKLNPPDGIIKIVDKILS